jgi:hypothetical protein
MRQLKLPTLTLFALLTLCAGVLAQADEGMWTFHNPPIALVKQKYGIDLTRNGWSTCGSRRCACRTARPRSYRRTA